MIHDENAARLFRPWESAALAIYLGATTAILAYLIYEFWPSFIPDGQGDLQPSQLSVFGISFTVTAEAHLIILVMVAGMIGGQVHALRSFADFLGNRSLIRSWLWWYLFRPFIGLPIALIIYLLVRGGLLSNSTGPEGISTFGIAGIAAISGMFSDMAAEFLRKVAKNVFQVETDVPARMRDSSRD